MPQAAFRIAAVSFCRFASRAPGFSRFVNCLLALTLSSGFGLPAEAGEREFVINEQLGAQWRNELVTFSFEAGQGECSAESLRLVGPAGDVPVQLVTREDWPGDGNYVRAGTVAFFVDVPPLSTLHYRLQFEAAASGRDGPPRGIRTLVAQDVATVSTDLVQARFHVGEASFDPPLDPSQVPAPLASLVVEGRPTLGGSRLYGPTKIASWSGRVTANGPVFAEIRWVYRYVGGTTMQIRARIGLRDAAIYWDMSCSGNLLQDGWEVILADDLPNLSFSCQMEFFSKRPEFQGKAATVGDVALIPLQTHPDGLITNIVPWGDWFNDFTQTVVILEHALSLSPIVLASRDPAVWVAPVEVVPSFGKRQPVDGRFEKRLQLSKNMDGSIALRANVIHAPGGGLRRWITGMLHRDALQHLKNANSAPNREITERALQNLVDKRRLDRVKDFILAWDEGALKRPHLFATRAMTDHVQRSAERRSAVLEAVSPQRSHTIGTIPDASDAAALAAWLATGSQRVASEYLLVDRLRQRLALLGDLDLMRHPPTVAALYDAVIDSGLITPRDRALFSAQMAYLGYRLEDPATWSLQRGFNTGLPNMTVAYLLNLGIVACAIPSHPRAPHWVQPAIDAMDVWLEQDVGSRGEWMEGSHYDHVTAGTMLAFALSAKHAGFRDFSLHPKFQLLFDYIAKQYTPPDPNRGGFRVTPPLGRGDAGLRSGIFGAAAALAADSVPRFSREMQWAWLQAGAVYDSVNNAMCGAEHILMDSHLPSSTPAWGSESFPRGAVVLRKAFATPQEHYISLLFTPEPHFVRASEAGSLLMWFAYGQPIAGAFTGGYGERHELLMSRVVPARSPTPGQWRETNFHNSSGGLTRFSSQQTLDSCDAVLHIAAPASENWEMPADMPSWPAVASGGKTPITWRRQVLFVKGVKERDPSYLVMRDTVTGNQPTLWHFWSKTNGIREVVGENGPSTRTRFPAIADARPLRGQNFTGAGQTGIDLDYFVITPTDPRAQTLRWGRTYEGPPVRGYTERQDLLQLRLEKDGEYFVVLFPRPHTQPPPSCRVMADGKAVELRGEWGVDYVWLAPDAFPVRFADCEAKSRCGCIQRRATSTWVAIGGAGEVRLGGQTFSPAKAASWRVSSDSTITAEAP